MVVDIVVVDKQKKTAVVIDEAIPKWFKDGLMTQKKIFFSFVLYNINFRCQRSCLLAMGNKGQRYHI